MWPLAHVPAVRCLQGPLRIGLLRGHVGGAIRPDGLEGSLAFARVVDIAAVVAPVAGLAR